jgi:hypothetical protein
MLKIKNKKRFFIFILCAIAIVAIIIFGVVFAVNKYRAAHPKSLHEMSFSEAGKIGEKKVMQVVIKINKITSNSKNEPVRGDVIMVAPEDKQWSDAEQEGFLIIKVNLTPDQAALLVQPKEDLTKKTEENSKTEKFLMQQPAIIQARRYTIDLEKIGIGSDEERGKIISDKVFDGSNVVIDKK